MAFPDYFYEKLRRSLLAGVSFAESNSSPLQEKLLYAIWSHQRIRSPLCTFEGKPIEVLHPGFRSVEGGPDFKGAFIRLGDQAPIQCDVEIDLEPAGWQQHGHANNPAYKGVGLQIVWNIPKGFKPDSSRNILLLRDYLDAPAEELLEWCLTDDALSLPPNIKGLCANVFSHLSESDFFCLLEQAAMVRLKSKSLFIAATARIYGWERALYIHLLRGLGYKQNTWPMQRLGELISPMDIPILNMQALLLGISGMLPAKLSETDSQKDAYILQLWDVWWRQQSEFNNCIFPISIWKLHNTRPINHPQRRIALAAHWLSDIHFCQRLENWGIHAGELNADTLFALLAPQTTDVFWEHRYTLRSQGTKKTLPLLGGERVADLFINVIAPWFLARTDRGYDPLTRQRIQDCYLHYPASQENALIRHISQRLYGNVPPPRLKYAYQQQGLLQIASDFCAKTTPCCHHCPLPNSLQEQMQHTSA